MSLTRKNFSRQSTPVGRMINNSSLFFFICYEEEKNFFKYKGASAKKKNRERKLNVLQ